MQRRTWPKSIIPQFALWLKIAVLSTFLGVSCAHAGSPGPYNLVFLDISHPPYRDGQGLMKQLRKLDDDERIEAFSNAPRLEGYSEGDCFICPGGIDSIDSIGHLYLYTIPIGLTIEDARQAVAGDITARDKIQKILQDFSNHNGETLDGMILYEHIDGKVTLYSVIAKTGTAITSVNKPVKNYLRLSSLDALIYQAAQKIPRSV